jgi:hypothetical protein
MKFKKGDNVVCVINANAEEYVTIGKSYEIEYIEEVNGEYRIGIYSDFGCAATLKAFRFIIDRRSIIEDLLYEL